MRDSKAACPYAIAPHVHGSSTVCVNYDGVLLNFLLTGDRPTSVRLGHMVVLRSLNCRPLLSLLHQRCIEGEITSFVFVTFTMIGQLVLSVEDPCPPEVTQFPVDVISDRILPVW